jgi:hypothetical protein
VGVGVIQITPQMRILVAIEPVDGRKGIDSLARLCQDKLQADPFSGCLFVFRSRRGTSIRILVYPQHLGCLRPQRAVTFFAAFAEQSELIRPRELQVVCPEVDHLLDAGPSIEHRGQQRVVPAPVRGGPVDPSEHCFDLRAIEVFDDALVCPFEGDTSTRWALSI